VSNHKKGSTRIQYPHPISLHQIAKNGNTMMQLETIDYTFLSSIILDRFNGKHAYRIVITHINGMMCISRMHGFVHACHDAFTISLFSP